MAGTDDPVGSPGMDGLNDLPWFQQQAVKQTLRFVVSANSTLCP